MLTLIISYWILGWLNVLFFWKIITEEKPKSESFWYAAFIIWWVLFLVYVILYIWDYISMVIKVKKYINKNLFKIYEHVMGDRKLEELEILIHDCFVVKGPYLMYFKVFNKTLKIYHYRNIEHDIKIKFIK